MIATHCYMLNNRQYTRFKRIHNEASEAGGSVQGISAETAKWYRDVYRRYRDYSILSIVAVYVLQVMDANVFAYMHDFEVSDDIAMRVEPAIIPPSEFAPHLGNCRFTKCTHTKEQGCAILDAVKRGEIAKSRHDSFVAIYDVLKNKHEWDT